MLSAGDHLASRTPNTAQRTPRFYCDQNVLRLAKYLRFAGFDTMTRRELSKHKIDAICHKERRVFITRSKHKDIKQFRSKTEILDATDVFEQLAYILSKYPVNKENIGTRCIECNVILKVRSEECGERSEKYCSRCGKHFWQGTHYHEMLKKII